MPVQFTAVIELSDLNGKNGFVMNGVMTGDYSGRRVTSVGDINDDGVSDIMIGANHASPNGFQSGQNYVVFGGNEIGSPDGTIQLSSLRNGNGFFINGIAEYNYSGTFIASAGDVNADGIVDLIVGAPGASPNGFQSGQSYVIFGSVKLNNMSIVELSNLNGDNGFQINGIKSADYSGYSVASAGDVNGDSIADLIVGAYGAAPNGFQSGQSYVIFGSSTLGGSGTLQLSNLNGSNGFQINGIVIGGKSGDSVASAGDVNNDGIADLIIGAYEAFPNGSNSGQSYVIFGSATIGNSGIIELSELNGNNGFQLNGIQADDDSGHSVASAGDVNNDGVTDFIIGAYKASPNGDGSGQSYVIFGCTGLGNSGVMQLSDLNGSNGFKVNGIDQGDESGVSVASAGDVNNDGIIDFIIGTYSASPNGRYSGQSYVIFGDTMIGSSGTIELSDLDGSNGFQINGIAGDDNSGFSVASAGDVNNDGVVDVIVGAPNASPNGLSSGQSYVVLGDCMDGLSLLTNQVSALRVFAWIV